VDRRIPIRAPRPLQWGRRLVDLLGPTGDAARQSLVALVFNSATSLVAGLALGLFVTTFEELPGLLLMVPAAIGLRGNVFGTFGNRLSTAVHTGAFTPSLRSESVLGQNVLASMVLTLSMSVVLAAVAWVTALAFGVVDAIDLLDMVFISVVGGVMASLVVLGASVLLALTAVRREWDLDNLVAPTVSTLGDVITIPCLWLASRMLGDGSWTEVAAAVLTVLAAAALLAAWRTRHEEVRRITIESVPVLTMALVLSTLAGLAMQKRIEVLAVLPALLVLQPAFVSSAGALGGILSGRVATNLHLGIVEPTMAPGREVRRDALLVLAIGLPVYVLNGVGSEVVATLTGQDGPGVVRMVGVALAGGLVTVLFVTALAYYGTIAAWRVDLDPDTVGLPVVTASVDFVGVIALIGAAAALRVI
jgi:mgtE-like transporter